MLLSIHRDHKDYLGRGAQDVHLDVHTALELWTYRSVTVCGYSKQPCHGHERYGMWICLLNLLVTRDSGRIVAGAEKTQLTTHWYSWQPQWQHTDTADNALTNDCTLPQMTTHWQHTDTADSHTNTSDSTLTQIIHCYSWQHRHSWPHCNSWQHNDTTDIILTQLTTHWHSWQHTATADSTLTTH